MLLGRHRMAFGVRGRAGGAEVRTQNQHRSAFAPCYYNRPLLAAVQDRDECSCLVGHCASVLVCPKPKPFNVTAVVL